MSNTCLGTRHTESIYSYSFTNAFKNIFACQVMHLLLIVDCEQRTGKSIRKRKFWLELCATDWNRTRVPYCRKSYTPNLDSAYMISWLAGTVFTLVNQIAILVNSYNSTTIPFSENRGRNSFITDRSIVNCKCIINIYILHIHNINKNYNLSTIVK